MSVTSLARTAKKSPRATATCTLRDRPLLCHLAGMKQAALEILHCALGNAD
jgi:hypothetical protein